MKTIIVYQDSSIRLDQYLAKANSKLSRSNISRLIEAGEVSVNKKRPKPSTLLRTGDRIEYDSEIFKVKPPEQIVLPIIYEDDFCIVINKPSGILTHAKGNLSSEPTVASFISKRIDQSQSGNRAGIVHRLDRGTSGVIIAAKSEKARIYLQRQFSKRQVQKVYHAIVTGILERKEAEINMPIERNPKRPASFRVGPNGKTATTTYEVISTSNSYSLVKLQPKTGRTHQLRVHLKAINHPIVGDEMYGGETYKRLMLHASSLEVILPDKGRVIFDTELPKEFNEFDNFQKEFLN